LLSITARRATDRYGQFRAQVIGLHGAEQADLSAEILWCLSARSGTDGATRRHDLGLEQLECAHAVRQGKDLRLAVHQRLMEMVE
jgi:hypothetical protein